MSLQQHALQIIETAISAVKPDRLIQQQISLKNNQLTIQNKKWDLSRFENVYVIGAGKASAVMAQALEEILGNRVTGGLVVVKYEHGAPCRKIQIREGGHPIIDENSLEATHRLLELAGKIKENDLVFCLISGGGSALLEKLPEGIELKDLQTTFRLLLESGVAIEEVNTVRKHLSLVKGGQLARAVYPAGCISLILSDIIGDPVESIASGPTAADSSTFQDAWQVIEKYRIQDRLPESVRIYLQSGAHGEKPETVKPGDPLFENVENIILGNNFLALQAAEKKAQELGYGTLILSSRIQGEAREVAKVIAGIMEEIPASELPLPAPACILLGGETTVTIRGDGKGGRNQELALAGLLALKNLNAPYVLISCGTDGTDGPTDAAGAIASPEIWQAVQNNELNPLQFLERNDSYAFFERTGGLIKTGPTGTNVMDIIIALVK